MNEMEKKGTIWDVSLDAKERIDWLIRELTLDEKLHMLSSGSGGVERLRIPDCRLGGEAAHGVEARNDQFNGNGVPDYATSFPQPIGMSSSWDQEAIRAAGEIVGREARSIYYRHPWGGISRWAPTVDLLRDPRWGRNEEAYGEDPVQAGAMASAYVRGIQTKEQGQLICAATLKHYYANNTEIGRGWKNASIRPRDKYEYYLEPFRRCIEDGGVQGIMTAYNRINGVQGLFNEDVKYLLKEEFGLTHAVSDGGAMELSATYSHATAMDAETVARSIKAGVDALSGRPDAVYAAALDAYELGILSEEDMDEAIRNVYMTKLQLGLFDEDLIRGKIGEPCGEDARKICKTLTDKALVLLKNDGALPMSEAVLRDSVLIGPVGDKWYQDWYGGAAPEHVSLLDGLGEYGISYLDGCDRISIQCGDKYLAADEEGRYRLSDVPEIFVLEDWGEGSYTLRNESTGKYVITNLADDVIEGGAPEGSAPARISGKVCVGKERIFSWFDLEVFRISADAEAKESGEGVALQDRFGNRLFADKDGWIVTAQSRCTGLTPLTFKLKVVGDGMEKAKEAASKAGTVILALGHNPMVNAKEEIDRATIAFIPSQQRLFDEICKVNPNVIVVLMSNYPFAIGRIHEKARAILWSSTGSQCMGQSLADAISGKISPAGRLTQTWHGSDEELPDIDDYDVIGGGRTYRYFEGQALYPFGHGLTYGEFTYRDLKLTILPGEGREHSGKRHKIFGQPNGVYDVVRKDGRVLKVELTVTNVGERSSDEVIQIYAKAPKGYAKKPRKQLIGFDRVKEIAPGETRNVELFIPMRELAFYDVVRGALIVEDGEYEITAAPSSEAAGIAEVIKIEGKLPVLRDTFQKIKADHFDEQQGAQIVEGLYGFSALMAEGPNAYEPKADGSFSASYANCRIPENAKALRIHGCAPENCTVRVYVEDTLVGEARLNTKDYDKSAGPARNHMPRAVEDDRLRRSSFPLLWADVNIPVDLGKLKKIHDSHGREIRIEVAGAFKYDWFMVRE